MLWCFFLSSQPTLILASDIKAESFDPTCVLRRRTWWQPARAENYLHELK